MTLLTQALVGMKKRLRWLIIISLICAATIAVYSAYVVGTANFHVVLNGSVYRSGQMDARHLASAIEKHGIKSILNLRGENSTADWYLAEMKRAASLNVVHHDRKLSSGREVTLEEMDELVALLRGMPKPLLIHCEGGADRSGLTSALYLFAVEKQKPEEAVGELSIWYGHVPLIRPKVLAMDRSFWRYVINHPPQVELNQSSAFSKAEPPRP